MPVTCVLGTGKPRKAEKIAQLAFFYVLQKEE